MRLVVVRAAVVEGAGMRPDRHAIRSAGSDGWLLFLRTLFLRGAFFVLTAATARLGEVELAAQQIAMQIWTLLALALDSLEVAAQTLVGRGARWRARRAAHTRRAPDLALGHGVGFAAARSSSSRFTTCCRTSSPTTPPSSRWPASCSCGSRISQPLGGPAFVLDGILVGSGDLKFLAMAMAAISLIVIVGEPIVLWLGGGIGWLWAVFTVFMAARVVVLGLSGGEQPLGRDGSDAPLGSPDAQAPGREAGTR